MNINSDVNYILGGDTPILMYNNIELCFVIL